MLGRRALVGVTVAAFAVTGGGAALAATHGSPHASKPSQMRPYSQGKCPNMGPTTTSTSGV
jgi:hypothetical protein